MEMTGGLIELAQKYVALTAELEATRAAIAMGSRLSRSPQVKCRSTTTQARLKRLEAKSLIERGEDGWRTIGS
jgi:hypothetical protein